MCDLTEIEIEDIDILAEKIETIGHALSVLTPDDIGHECGSLHYEGFEACERHAKEIRQKLKEIINKIVGGGDS